MCECCKFYCMSQVCVFKIILDQCRTMVFSIMPLEYDAAFLVRGISSKSKQNTAATNIGENTFSSSIISFQFWLAAFQILASFLFANNLPKLLKTSLQYKILVIIQIPSGYHTYCLTHLHTHTHTHLYTYTLTHSHTHTLTHSHTYTLTDLHTYTLTHLHTYTLTHLHTYRLTHLHTDTLTH